MCGFSGIWHASGGDFSSQLHQMGRAIAHRGPDSAGIWIDKDHGIGLVHQRLAVLDISETGQQPMASANDRYIICYNGEIYNHLQIRDEITATDKNVQWRGTSDTETLLSAILIFGIENTLSKLVGMFAFALWDRQANTLTLVRDRFGEKPLYYGWHQDQFVFSSELKSLAAISGFNLEIDKSALSLYFRHNYVPAPYSIYHGISKLEPGSMLCLTPANRQPDISTYWSAIDASRTASLTPFHGDINEAAEQVESLLSESIKGQMIADVPVGAFLSGGIDSSTVVALMQRQSTQSVNTFSIGFDDARFNEAHHAKAVASALKTNHTELYLSDKDIEQLVKDLPGITDEPFADSSLLPTHAVAKLARESVTVSLSGDGGDELFGGYTRFVSAGKAMKLRRRLSKPGHMTAKALITSPLMRKSLSGLPQWNLSALRNNPVGFRSGLVLQLLAQPSDSLAYRELLSFWRNPCSPMINPSNPKTWFHQADRWLSNVHDQEAIQMMDVQTFLADDILVKVDRAAMNVSLETRVPMLDHRFAEFVWSLPASYRTQCERRSIAAPKRILRKIAHKYVPKNQIDRQKMGFGIPLELWLRGPLKDWAQALIDPVAIEKQGLLNAKSVDAIWQQTLQGIPNSSELLWSILMFQHWLNHTHSVTLRHG